MRGWHDVERACDVYTVWSCHELDHGTSCYAVMLCSIALVDIIKFEDLNIELIVRKMMPKSSRNRLSDGSADDRLLHIRSCTAQSPLGQNSITKEHEIKLATNNLCVVFYRTSIYHINMTAILT